MARATLRPFGPHPYEVPASMNVGRAIFLRATLFASYCLFLILVFWSSLVSLSHLALHNDYCTHILLIPFLSVFLVYLDRKRIFRSLTNKSSTFGERWSSCPEQDSIGREQGNCTSYYRVTTCRRPCFPLCCWSLPDLFSSSVEVFLKKRLSRFYFCS
jgi:hypothetical protein